MTSNPRALTAVAICTVALTAILQSLNFRSIDPCLVGNWTVTASSGFPARGDVNFRDDGTAQVTDDETTYHVDWQVRGQVLQMQLQPQRFLVDADHDPEPAAAWRMRWTILEKLPRRIRLLGPEMVNRPSGEVVLTRDDT